MLSGIIINNKNIKKVVKSVFAGKGFISIHDGYEAGSNVFHTKQIDAYLLISRIHKYHYYYDESLFDDIFHFFNDDIVNMMNYIKNNRYFVFSEYSKKILDKSNLIKEISNRINLADKYRLPPPYYFTCSIKKEA